MYIALVVQLTDLAFAEENSQLKELIVTDSIPREHKSDKVKVLSCAPLFADVMHRVNSNTSIASKFIM